MRGILIIVLLLTLLTDTTVLRDRKGRAYNAFDPGDCQQIESLYGDVANCPDTGINTLCTAMAEFLEACAKARGHLHRT